MSKSFDDLWRFICKRSEGFPVVQEYHELEYVFNKMQGFSSYLEVGTAEGNSMYVLSHALNNEMWCPIWFVDYGESHTKLHRDEILSLLPQAKYSNAIRPIYANSHHPKAVLGMETDEGVMRFDCVMIDAGHTYEDVIADAIAYGSLATKYIFFHDIMLPEVGKAFDWYCKQRPECNSYRIVNSETFGYGIMEIK